MDRIDLHTHSTASDGSMTPSELVHHAASCGLRAVALTDHDTTVGLTEAQQAANEIGIELVHGVELATWLDKTEFHIVGLDINENNPHFQTAMARMQQIREDRNNQMVARMQAAGYVQYEFIKEELRDLLAAADLIISRAGANAICEILALRKPNILIPLPAAASRGDQILNAESFQKQGFSYLLPEEEITNEKFLDTIHQVYSDRENYQKQMASSQQNQAIPIIADLIDQLASV